MTGNKKDFCSKSGELDGELLYEVATIHPDLKLRHAPSIRELVEEFRAQFEVEDREHRQSLLVAAVEEYGGHDDLEPQAAQLEQAISDAVSAAAGNLVGESVTGWKEDDRHVGLTIGEAMPEGLSEATIETVEVTTNSLDYQVHDRYDGDTVALTVTVDATMTLDGFIEKAVFYANDDPTFEVHDSDWNDHVMWVSAPCTARLTFNVIAVGTQVQDTVLEGAGPL